MKKKYVGMQTLSIMATTEGYGVPVTEETRRLYGYSHVLEAGKPVTLRVVDSSKRFTYDWRVRQHDGATLLRCVCRQMTVWFNASPFQRTNCFYQGGGPGAGGERPMHQTRRGCFHQCDGA